MVVVAIVEDDPSLLNGIARLLKASGFDTEVYDSAEAFLAGASETRAGCLLLDINLGGISGIELRRRLSAAGNKLPTIFMTAAESELQQQTATEAGCVAYLRKPVPARRLIQAISEAIA